jgi:prolyl oligopeptidase
MKRCLLTLSLLLAACTTAPPAAEDPYLWLEEVDGPRALAWVAEQNERTRRALAGTPQFEEMQRQALTALSSTSRIPEVEFHGRHLYNLWKDADHPRGLYRRTTLDELGTASPRWTTVLDIDELSRREGKPWVLKWLECLGPSEERCLVALSPGGGDAVEIREFDAVALRFVEGGFFVPEAKSNAEWIDLNTIYVATDFGPGSLTESGYPRTVRRWRRGTERTSAEMVYEGRASSVSSTPVVFRSAGRPIELIDESPDFWRTRLILIDGSERRPLDVPETATLAGAHQGKLVLALHDPWREFPAGAVVLVDPRTLEAALVVSPAAGAVVQSGGVEANDSGIFVPMLDNVRGRLVRYTSGIGRETIEFPDNGALSVMTADEQSGVALVSFETFISPPALYLVPPGRTAPVMVKAQEPAFDGSPFEVTQEWAVSRDGTPVPYFVVARRGMKRDGNNPTHIFSYGGFRSALTPSYSGTYEPHQGAYGKLWLERGGVFVLANIRGGGEFGPPWHAAALKASRPRAFEDFEAVAENLIRTGVTSPGRLGIEGRSNGGLLTLATMVRRPDLYGAVISGAPLADMRRYHQMLAGASWIAEYGDPRLPAEWDFLRSYSPYQNFKASAGYPPLFVYASTRDDRVHPGHARKAVALLQAQGHEVLYYENVEGGHGGSSTNEQLAYRIALSYAHLWKTLSRR